MVAGKDALIKQLREEIERLKRDLKDKEEMVKRLQRVRAKL